MNSRNVVVTDLYNSNKKIKVRDNHRELNRYLISYKETSFDNNNRFTLYDYKNLVVFYGCFIIDLTIQTNDHYKKISFDYYVHYYPTIQKIWKWLPENQ